MFKLCEWSCIFEDGRVQKNAILVASTTPIAGIRRWSRPHAIRTTQKHLMSCFSYSGFVFCFMILVEKEKSGIYAWTQATGLSLGIHSAAYVLSRWWQKVIIPALWGFRMCRECHHVSQHATCFNLALTDTLDTRIAIVWFFLSTMQYDSFTDNTSNPSSNLVT